MTTKMPTTPTTTTTTTTTTVTTILTTTTVTTVVTEPEVVPEEETTVAIIVTESPVPSSPLLCLALIPSLLMIPLLLVCICCCKRIVKEPPATQKQEKKPCAIQPCTRVIFPHCECQEDSTRPMEGRGISCTLMERHPSQMLYGPNICLPPSQERFPLNSWCSRCQHAPPICSQPPSRMPLLIPPRALELCRATLSLPPP
nr:anthrax toxin receptor-like [Camelus bactrianus]